MIPDEQFLKVDQVLDSIKEAIEQNTPFSLLRVGDGENIVMAQDSILTIPEVLNRGWAKAANEGKKGVTIPNLELRDEMVEALKKADLIGIPFWENDPIMADQIVKRPLTEAIFKYFNIVPSKICHTFVNRVLTQKKEFWSLLKGKRILLIGSWADQVKPILEKEPYGLNIAITYEFTKYDHIKETLDKVTEIKDEFDIALVSCGVNAVVLAQRIAELTGKVALDFGKSLMFIVQKKAGLIYYSHQANLKLLP